ncbi:FecR family protein [Pseudocolwellia sp. HL-MZ7]|uniref:FecR family protein n=1 Tax=Pseudocolwellia sp. HL-MZ7 TaxID=3400627 RepID=UPI003CE84B3A
MNLHKNTAQRVQAQAAHYITRLYSGELTEQEENQVYQWLEESDDNKEEYQRQLELWDSSSDLILPTQKTEHKLFTMTFFNRYTSIAATALIAMTLFIVSITQVTQAPSIVYKTKIGEMENITLSDKSVITLNTNSEIKVTLTKEARKVDLISGEAFFIVTSNKERPFIVTSGGQEITVVGTQFNVHKMQTSIEVAVIEGIVQVKKKLKIHSRSKLKPMAQDKYLLEKGNIGTFNSAAEIIMPINNDKLAKKTSWRNGLLIFKDESLQTVINELNRYRQNKIELKGKETQALKISGAFDFTQKEQVISGLLQTLPIKMINEGDKIILTSNNSGN